MSEKRFLALPRAGSKYDEIEVDQRVLVVGANGAGKTRLGAWIEFQSPQKELVHRISAQKSLVMPDSIAPISIEKAQQALLFGHADWNRWDYKINKWQGKPATGYLTDYEQVMVYLFSEEMESNAEFKDRARGCTERIEPPVTKLDQLKEVWEKILPHRELVIGGLRVQTRVKGGGGSAYNASEMSDGERVVFYQIGQCLAAPQGG